MSEINRISLLTTFDELKSHGCICQERILEFKNDSDCPIFWAEPRKNTIIANEAFPFSDNDLVKKYILLHEEGHFKSFDWKIFLKYNTLFVFLAGIILVCATVIPSLYLIFMILEFFYSFPMV